MCFQSLTARASSRLRVRTSRTAKDDVPAAMGLGRLGMLCGEQAGAFKGGEGKRGTGASAQDVKQESVAKTGQARLKPVLLRWAFLPALKIQESTMPHAPWLSSADVQRRILLVDGWKPQGLAHGFEGPKVAPGANDAVVEPDLVHSLVAYGLPHKQRTKKVGTSKGCGCGRQKYDSPQNGLPWEMETRHGRFHLRSNCRACECV